jgi:hypothetical protein
MNQLGLIVIVLHILLPSLTLSSWGFVHTCELPR